MHTTVVTGASAGIGFETARALALRGHRVLVVGRNPERTMRSCAALKSSTGNPHIEFFLADFANFESVRTLSRELRRSAPHITCLINNAGLWHQERHMSQDGFEETYAVNHLAPFLLTHLLLPSLLRGPPGRILFVSSRLHAEVGPFDFDDLAVEKNTYRGLEVYGRSKLANLLCANEFARRLVATQPQVTSSSVHPGAVQTRIVRDNALLKIGVQIVGPFLRTAEEGAATSVYAATHPSLERVTAAYYSDGRQVPPSIHARDSSAALRLWNLSIAQTRLAAHELHESVSVRP